jgi:hypothetical protein
MTNWLEETRKKVTMTFEEACERAQVYATKRQLSKWRNGYGAAALAAGKNIRPQPKRAS